MRGTDGHSFALLCMPASEFGFTAFLVLYMNAEIVATDFSFPGFSSSYVRTPALYSVYKYIIHKLSEMDSWERSSMVVARGIGTAWVRFLTAATLFFFEFFLFVCFQLRPGKVDSFISHHCPYLLKSYRLNFHNCPFDAPRPLIALNSESFCDFE